MSQLGKGCGSVGEVLGKERNIARGGLHLAYAGHCQLELLCYEELSPSALARSRRSLAPVTWSWKRRGRGSGYRAM